MRKCNINPDESMVTYYGEIIRFSDVISAFKHIQFNSTYYSFMSELTYLCVIWITTGWSYKEFENFTDHDGLCNKIRDTIISMDDFSEGSNWWNDHVRITRETHEDDPHSKYKFLAMTKLAYQTTRESLLNG